MCEDAVWHESEGAGAEEHGTDQQSPTWRVERHRLELMAEWAECTVQAVLMGGTSMRMKISWVGSC